MAEQVRRVRRADFKSYFSDVVTITPVAHKQEYLKILFTEYTIQPNNVMAPEDICMITMPRAVIKEFAELLLKYSSDKLVQ